MWLDWWAAISLWNAMIKRKYTSKTEHGKKWQIAWLHLLLILDRCRLRSWNPRWSMTESFPTQYSEISINQLCKVVEDRVSMHDAHILKVWMIIIVVDLKTPACFQCVMHTFAIWNEQFNSGPSAIKNEVTIKRLKRGSMNKIIHTYC